MRAIRKGLILLLLFSLTLSCLCACGTSPSGDGQQTGDVPRRVAVLFSSLADIWTEAGGTIAITVKETVERGFADPSVTLVDDGAGKNINTELLLASEPDLVIASADIPAQVAAADLARTAGIPTLVLRVECFDDYLAALDVMTALTHDRSAYQRGLSMKQSIDGILSSPALTTPDSPSMLFIRSGSTNASTKPKQASDHFACAMLEEMGCHNILSDAPILLDGLNMEAILAIDPDFIFFSLMGDETAARTHIDALLGEATWQELSAVKNGNVFILPKDLFHFKPNARWGDAYRYLFHLLTGDDYE